jgi:hypothetical protein
MLRALKLTCPSKAELQAAADATIARYGKVHILPLGIGVSVLYPGFIRTKIMNSERNVPQRFAGPMEQPPTEGPGAEFLKMVEDRVSTGIDPLYVGELVREGIEQDGPTSSPTTSLSR